MWNKEIDGFTCDCKAYQFSSDNTCKHILAAGSHEGGSIT
ncbi:MAG: SWIM zinc finger family protein [Nitrososphaeraceae archaeon]